MNNAFQSRPGLVSLAILPVPETGSGPAVETGLTRLRRLVRTAMAGCGLAVVCGASLLFAGCQNFDGGHPQSSQQSVPDAEAGPVVLGEGDVVRVFYPGAAEYNTTQKIRTDGKLSLPVIGEIQAAGKTLGRLQSELSNKYKSQLVNSEVVLSLEASGKPVIISGGVASPGKIVLDRPTTLLEAIMGAGGFKDFARKKKVRLIRMVNGQYRTDIYDMSGGLTGRPTPLVYLRGGDVVYVPLSNW